MMYVFFFQNHDSSHHQDGRILDRYFYWHPGRVRDSLEPRGQTTQRAAQMRAAIAAWYDLVWWKVSGSLTCRFWKFIFILVIEHFLWSFVLQHFFYQKPCTGCSGNLKASVDSQGATCATMIVETAFSYKGMRTSESIVELLQVSLWNSTFDFMWLATIDLGDFEEKFWKVLPFCQHFNETMSEMSEHFVLFRFFLATRQPVLRWLLRSRLFCGALQQQCGSSHFDLRKDWMKCRAFLMIHKKKTQTWDHLNFTGISQLYAYIHMYTV